MIVYGSASGVIYYVVFSFRKLLFQRHVFWQYSIIFKSIKYVATSTYHRELHQSKLYSPPRNLRAGSKSTALFVKKPLYTGDLSLRSKYSSKGLIGLWQCYSIVKNGFKNFYLTIFLTKKYKYNKEKNYKFLHELFKIIIQKLTYLKTTENS